MKGGVFMTNKKRQKNNKTNNIKSIKNGKPSYEKSNEKKQIGSLTIKIVAKIMIALILVLVMVMLDSQKRELFQEIQSLKVEITQLKKDNDQLEISIQNSLNLNNIEQAAKELLGMQKLTSKQTLYINLPKKDYVEPRAEEVVVDENKNIFEKIIGIFKK